MLRATLGSWLYKKVRRSTINGIYARQAAAARPRDLEEAVEKGDAWLKKLDNLSNWTTLPFDFPIPKGIGARLHDLYFPSPLTAAAFKDDLQVISLWLRLGLGGATLKTTMFHPREGNPRPRLQEVGTNSCVGLINAMDLPGKGVEQAINNPWNEKVLACKRPIGISIGGSSLEEYVTVFDRWNAYLSSRPKEDKYYIEINISCPNTPEGQQMTQHPELLEELLTILRKKTKSVIGVKLSPDQSNDSLSTCALITNQYQPSYVNLGNTTYRKCQDLGLPENAITVGGGGFSGPLLYTRTVEMVKMIAPIGIPIIATGGIDSAGKVRHVQDHGATVVGMATAVVQDMYCIPRINYELAKKRK